MQNYYHRLAFLGVIVFIFSFSLKIPAAYVVSKIKTHIPETIQWSRIEGTTFNANIRDLTFNLNNGRIIYFKSVDLETSPLALLIGQIKTKVSARHQIGTLSAKLVAGFSSWQLKQISGEFDLGELQTDFPELRGIGVRGRISLMSRKISGDYGALPSKGDASLIINQLRIGMIEDNFDLGNYELSLNINTESDLSVILQTLTGNNIFFIEGNGNLDMLNNNMSFRGQSWVADDAPDTIKELLPLMGNIENGRVLLDWQQQVNLNNYTRFKNLP